MKLTLLISGVACCAAFGVIGLAAPKTAARTGADGHVSLHPVYPPGYEEHQDWVAQSVKRMQTIKAGMTRSDLNRVFMPEGGFFQSSSQTYLYRDCPYFKVRVTFKLFGSGLEPGGNPKDEILSISEPVVNTVSQPN